MAQTTKDIRHRIETWSGADQEGSGEVERDIEARRTGLYQATSEELAAIDEALCQIARGLFATEEEIEAAFAKFSGT